jgi:Ca2+-transporting ATPase
MGLVMSLVALGVGWFAYRMGLAHWQSVLFTTLIFSQLALALEARSEENSLFQIGIFSNPSMLWALAGTVALQVAVLYVPFLQNVFSTEALSIQELLIAAGAGLVVLLVAEIWKVYLRRR